MRGALVLAVSHIETHAHNQDVTNITRHKRGAVVDMSYGR